MAFLLQQIYVVTPHSRLKQEVASLPDGCWSSDPPQKSSQGLCGCPMKVKERLHQENVGGIVWKTTNGVEEGSKEGAKVH